MVDEDWRVGNNGLKAWHQRDASVVVIVNVVVVVVVVVAVVVASVVVLAVFLQGNSVKCHPH